MTFTRYEQLSERIKDVIGNKPVDTIISLRNILQGSVKTERLPFKVGFIHQILKEQFSLDVPESLWKLFRLDDPKQKAQLIEINDKNDRGNLRDFIFLIPPAESKGDVKIDDAVKTIHIGISNQGKVSVRLGGVITCRDGIERVAGIEFVEDKDKIGFVVKSFDLSSNGFGQIENSTLENDRGFFPTRSNEPLLTDAIITWGMLKQIGKAPESDRCFRFYNSAGPPDFMQPNLKLSYDDAISKPSMFPIDLDDEKNNFTISIGKGLDTKPLVTFPSRIHKTKSI